MTLLWLVTLVESLLVVLNISKLCSNFNLSASLSMAAFRYPHRTRSNSGPDQIILVLKISTEPSRSRCGLHIRAKGRVAT